MADKLMPEILDRIFYYLGDWERSRLVPLDYKHDLYSAALVCRSWCAQAQRLTHRCIELDSARRLQRFAQYLTDTGERRSHIEYLHLELYSLYLSEPDRLYPQPIWPGLPHLQTVRELHVATHQPLADPGLAQLIAGLPSLETLVVEHYMGDQSRSQRTYADASPLLLHALPKLEKLRNLYMERLQLPTLPDFLQRPPFHLKQLALNECIFDDTSLRWLTSSRSLCRLGLAIPQGISQDGMVRLFQAIGSDLSHLMLGVHPTYSLISIYNLESPATFVSASPYAGLANRILPLCPNLQCLVLQELSVNPDFLEANNRLETLEINLVDPASFSSRLSRYRLRSLHQLHLYSPCIAYRHDRLEMEALRNGLENQGIASVYVGGEAGFDVGWTVVESFVAALPSM